MYLITSIDFSVTVSRFLSYIAKRLPLHMEGIASQKAAISSETSFTFPYDCQN